MMGIRNASQWPAAMVLYVISYVAYVSALKASAWIAS
jgi:hypothetical protein